VTSPAGGPVRLGLLGCADIAWRRTLPAVASGAGLRLAAVASRHPATAERFTRRFGGVPLVGYQALLDRDEVEAVYIPLPPGLHAEWIGRALAAGKHVLAEKPLTTSGADSARALDQAAARGLVLMENVMFLHHPQHAAVERLLADGVIGDLRAFSGIFTIPRRPPGDIRHRPDLGGGARLDMAGYPVRAADRFLGPELAVAGAVLRHEMTGVDVGGAALLRDAAGIPACVVFGMDDGYCARYELSGSRGRIVLDRAYTPAADHRPVVRIESGGQWRELPLAAADQFAALLAVFAGAVRGTADTDLLTRLCAASLRHARLQDKILRAANGSPPAIC
jgi:NDP-hexose-3-ketoreductase